jgi:hypothetical protein
MAELDLNNLTLINTPATGLTAVYVDGTHAPTKRLRTINDSGQTVIFIGTNTTDTMTLKSFVDTTTSIVNVSDATKVLKFSCSGATTGTLLSLFNVQQSSQTLTFPNIRESETIAVQPQNVQFTGGTFSTTSTVGVMAGASSGVTRITPQVTGNIMIIITGMVLNSTIGDGTSIQIRYGTGNGPAPVAALTGTTIGVYKNFVASTAAGQQGFACCGYLTGATLGTALYIDAGIKVVTGGTGTFSGVDFVAYEF